MYLICAELLLNIKWNKILLELNNFHENSLPKTGVIFKIKDYDMELR